MRHRKAGRKLGRTWEHRKALMKNMARSLVEHEHIRTTEAKAKELSIFADKLITMALQDTLHARRQAFTVLGSHHSVKKLFDEIGPRFKEVPGGYTRVVKFGIPRVGDSASMALIEFTRLSDKFAETADAAAPEATEEA
jgi:large subunit ribosomal protein L17